MRRVNLASLAMAGVLLLSAGCSGAGETGDAVPWTAKVVAAGDIADCGSDGLQFPQSTRTAALVLPDDAIVLTLGDNTYPVGAASEFTDCFQANWGQFKSRIRPSPGNHDYMTTDAAGYFGYFGAAAGPPGRGYYSFDVGPWHLISLNSNIDAVPGSAQYTWLQADLAASTTLCTLAYWHHPVFSSGPHGNNPKMADIVRLLQGAGVELVLVGHDHVYERFAPQDADGRPDPRGVRHITAGTGGARLYSWKEPRANSEYRDNSTHGVLRLTLREAGYEWSFAAVNGPSSDIGSATCHR